MESQNELRTFSYHRNSGYLGILIAIIFIVLVESIGLFFLLHLWLPWLSWLHLALNVYAIYYLVRDYVGIVRKPFYIEGSEVVLNVGYRKTLSFRLDQIKEVRSGQSYEQYKKDKTVFKALLVESETPQLEIELTEPVWTKNPLGKKMSIHRVFVTVDQKDEFMRNLTHSSSPLSRQ